MPVLTSVLLATVFFGVGVSPSAGEEDVLAIPSSVQDERGLEMLGGRLWVSAFANVAFEALEHHPEEVNLDDLGVLVRWDALEWLSFFAAMEIEDALGWVDGHGVSFFDQAPAVERLYADIAFGSGTTVHVGKTLTPFGIWNPIRRAPLTWTVDRPLVTEIAFPFHVTGLSVSNKSTVGDWSIDSDLYGQPGGELDRISDEKAADGLLGGRVALGHSVPRGFATVGVQAAWFEDQDAEKEEFAVGLDLDLSIARQFVIAEVTFFDGEVDDYKAKWGTYLQVVSPIWRGLFGVVRGEMVGVDERDDYRCLILGLAWRAENERWMLKVNYQFSDNPLDDRTDGVSVALSFLF